MPPSQCHLIRRYPTTQTCFANLFSAGLDSAVGAEFPTTKLNEACSSTKLKRSFLLSHKLSPTPSDAPTVLQMA